MSIPPIPRDLFHGPSEPQSQILSNVAIRPLDWVEKPFLQADAFHLVAGRKNAGKGTWLALLAAHVTRGAFDRDDRSFGHRVVWIAGGEDSYAIDVRPRIEIAGGDSNLVTVPTLDTDIVLPNHLDVIKGWMGAPGEVGLVVIDPLGGAMENGRSTNADSDVRPMLRALNQLADEQRTMVFGSRNVSIKSAKDNGALGSILGSSSWIDLPRAVLGLFHDRNDLGLRQLHLLTGNRVPAGQPGLLLRIEGIVPSWGGDEISRMTVIGTSSDDPDELLAMKPDRANSRSAEAEVLIIDILAERGQLESSVLDSMVAEQTNLSARTIQKIRTERLGRNGRGLIQAIPDRPPGSERVKQWLVALTEAGRLEHEARYPSPPSQESTASRGSRASSFDLDPLHTQHTPTYTYIPVDTPLSLSLSEEEDGP